MTITVCVGASGSGKTTFLEDVHKVHPKCVYIRQYHMMRPYIQVKTIPDFDPTQLPFWETYEKEGAADTIPVGGTLAGKFTQGVTDDFVPFLKQRLEAIKEKHNVVLVTNDHVKLLKDMADNVITVSSLDRSVVKLNDQEGVDREKVILALAECGGKYTYEDNNTSGVKFFLDVQVVSNPDLRQLSIFATCVFGLYIATFWDSAVSSAPLVLLAGGIVAFFSLQPLLLSQVDWRNSMLEETEALVHSSAQVNRLMKLAFMLSLIFVLTAAEFGVVNAVMSDHKLFLEAKYWVAMLCDSASLTLPLACMRIYTHLPFQTVQFVGSLPFLGMLFLSTTFSPGAGLPVLKELRYIYPRFYFWCMVPGVQENMEECPNDYASGEENLIVLYMILSTFAGVFLVFFILAVAALRSKCQRNEQKKQRDHLKDQKFRDVEIELYGHEVSSGGSATKEKDEEPSASMSASLSSSASASSASNGRADHIV